MDFRPITPCTVSGDSFLLWSSTELRIRAGLSRFTRNFSPPTSDPARENPPFSTFNLNSPLTNIPVLYHPLPLSCIIFITVILGLFVTLGRSITIN